MGLFVEDPARIHAFLREARALCPVRVIDYDRAEKTFDNSIFYDSFVSGLCRAMDLPESARPSLLVNANLAMQTLDERGLALPHVRFHPPLCGAVVAKPRRALPSARDELPSDGRDRPHPHRTALRQQHGHPDARRRRAVHRQRLRLLPARDAHAVPPPRAKLRRQKEDHPHHPRRRGPLRAAAGVRRGAAERKAPSACGSRPPGRTATASAIPCTSPISRSANA